MARERAGNGIRANHRPEELRGSEEHEENPTVIAVPQRGALTERQFEGRIVRTLHINGEPWFVASDVCRALSLAAHKGSFGHHLRKLDDDEKRLVIRDAIEPATADPTLNAGRGRQDDPLSAEGGSQTWVVSEGGLYTVILRCREATTSGSFAHRFRRWVTKEVLPEVRRTGSYSVNGQIGQDGSIVLPPLDGVTRYVVVGVPGEAPHIRRTGLTEMVAENTSLDVQGLCYALKAIEVWWNKLQILNRSLSDPDQGFSARQLEKAILEGGALADRYLGLLTYLSADGIA